MSDVLLESIILSLGPTIAGLAAWNASRQNASQESVDELAARLDEHTAQDHVSFDALNTLGAELSKGQEVLHELVAKVAVDRFDAAQEAVRVAAVLAEVTRQTALTLAEQQGHPPAVPV